MDDVVAVVTDLISQSRILSASRRSGSSVRFVTTVEEARQADNPRLTLVDLDARADVNVLIRMLKRASTGPVIAYGPHLDGDKLKSARAAGADRVLARSKFVADLPDILSSANPATEDQSTR